jgi:hypothetical protein
VKTTIIAVLGLLLSVSSANAHGGGDGFGGVGDLGGLGFGLGLGGDHQGFGGFGRFGGDYGLGVFNADSTQTRFQSQFDTLKTKYDDGVANTTDFFTMDTYDNIVSKTERLDDRYGLFVTGVQHSIDTLGNLITQTNDDITFYNDLLTNYQSDTRISSTRLDRIELVINHVLDRLDSRVTSLTDKQTTLQTNFPTYQSFQTDLDKFLSDIQAAGSGTSGTTTSSVVSMLKANASSGFASAMLNSDMATCAAASGSGLTPTATPEPGTVVLLAVGFLAVGAWHPRRR